MILCLISLAAATGYAVSLYVWPFKPCPRCKGSGRNAGSTSRRYGSCKRRNCQRGTVQRLGSRSVHRAVRALVTYRRDKKD